jgi:hypothetical protein
VSQPRVKWDTFWIDIRSVTPWANLLRPLLVKCLSYIFMFLNLLVFKWNDAVVAFDVLSGHHCWLFVMRQLWWWYIIAYFKCSAYHWNCLNKYSELLGHPLFLLLLLILLYMLSLFDFILFFLLYLSSFLLCFFNCFPLTLPYDYSILQGHCFLCVFFFSQLPSLWSLSFIFCLFYFSCFTHLSFLYTS